MYADTFRPPRWRPPLVVSAMSALLLFAPSSARAQLGLDLTADEAPPKPAKAKPAARPAPSKPQAPPAKPEQPSAASPDPAAAAGGFAPLDVSGPSPSPSPAASEAAPAPAAGAGAGAATTTGLGLDLSDAAGPDLRPALALIGVQAAPADKALAQALAKALETSAKREKSFVRIVTPALAAQALEADSAAALACEQAACLADLATRLEVERVVVAQLAAGGARLRLLGYDVGTRAIEESPVDKPTEKSVGPAAATLFGKLGARLALLKVTVNAPNAEVALDGRPLGIAPIQKPVAAGKARLNVSAPDYQPVEAELELKPGIETEVNPQLEPKPSSAAAALAGPGGELQNAPAKSKSIFSRPGFYVMVVGLGAAGAGLGYGLAAASAESKAKDEDGNGISNISRVEMLEAYENAKMANILAPAGGAIAAAGLIWMFFDSGDGASSSAEPVIAASPTGFSFAVRLRH